MSVFSIIKRKADRDLYNDSSKDFIPIACHYDANTLLTKNGQLIQIIQINGINSERVSGQLFDLRAMVRNALCKSVHSDSFSFWIHTVRRKTNLDDTTPYTKLLPANIHDMWCNKNYWNDKFVNTLYISIIYSAPDIKIKNLNAFATSFLYEAVVDFHDKYYVDAFNQLNSTVDQILECLSEYGATKLGISFEGEECYSDPMFLYRRIVHLNEDRCLLPIADLSSALGTNKYAVGSDKIEVIDDLTKKFASILSIKEYHEVSSEALDLFLQLPVELIVTEVVYFVKPEKVISPIKEQNYILKVSGDSMLRDVKGITAIMSDENPDKRFCHQQMSIMVIGDNIERLDEDTAHASSELSKIGIVHVREDINLEQTFWAQLPGNFSFLRRLAPTILDNTAALASLHNFPTGNQYSPWGKAITLLRTEKGTPYFFNFHDQTAKGNSCIFGVKGVGKTTLLNFLISESTKFDPSICYLTVKDDSKIFIEAIEGKWISNTNGIINPFLFANNPEAISFLTDFLKIICNHYVSPLSGQEISFIETLPEKIFALEAKDRNFVFILNAIDFSLLGGDTIKLKLNVFAENELYKNLFFVDENIKISETDINGINLHELSDKLFTEKFYLEDKKLIDKFQSDLMFHNSVRFAVVYALTYHFSTINGKPKILAIDGLEAIVNYKYFSDHLSQLSDLTTKANGVIISTTDPKIVSQFKEEKSLQNWLNSVVTKIILPSEYRIENLDKILSLNKIEIEKLSSFSVSSRMFLIAQNNKSIAAELSIGGLVSITKMLSCNPETLEVYKNILQSHPGGPNEWLSVLYHAI